MQRSIELAVITGILVVSIACNHNTLDQAYDQGGSGAGRVINANAGSVQINGSGRNLDVQSNVRISGELELDCDFVSQSNIPHMQGVSCFAGQIAIGGGCSGTEEHFLYLQGGPPSVFTCADKNQGPVSPHAWCCPIAPF